MLEVYILSGMCIVLIVALMLQIRPPVVRHSGKIAVRSSNRIIKITPGELQEIISENTEQLKRLHRSTSDDAAMAAVAAQVRRFVNTNQADDDNFPLIVDFMPDTLDIDDNIPAFALLMFELARLEVVMRHADKSMLDLDLMAGLIAQLHAASGNALYTGENQSSASTGIQASQATGQSLATLGALPGAFLKFGESTELSHRWHKPSKNMRPNQGEQSQEYERDF